MLDAGVDFNCGSDGRTSSVATTQRYDRRGDEAKKKAAKALHFLIGHQGKALSSPSRRYEPDQVFGLCPDQAEPNMSHLLNHFKAP